jgi:hypothetical protein
MSEEHRKYFGKKFYQQKDGYWANMMPIHAHRWVWINHFGAIPQGMDIHHKDGDKGNNEIENLEMLSRSDHLKRHRQEGRFDLDQRREQLKEARKWMKTEEGRKKQSEMAKESHKTRKLFDLKCDYCCVAFKSKQPWTKFCTPKCYMRNRRKLKCDLVTKNCLICNIEFITGKWAKHKFCSCSCSGKYSAKLRKIKDAHELHTASME